METLQRTANRGSVSTGYDIDNSTKFEADNTERMYRAWGGSGGGNDQTWTVSLWVKRTELGALQYIWGGGVSANDVIYISFEDEDTLKFRSTKDGVNDCIYVTNRKFRDTSAWYHIVTACDTTSGTAGNRIRFYINGVEETSFSTETDFAQNDNTLHNANSSYMEIGTVIGLANRFCGYIAEVISISGSQLAPTDFGEYDDDSGIWIPKQYTGSFPQNSVFLEFKDSSSLGTDTSGNGQTFTLQNISATDQATDTPTNNFATLNPVFAYSATAGANPIISEGATVLTTQQSGYWHNSVSTIAVTSGKWYFEAQPGTSSTHVTAIGYGDEEDVYTWGVANSHVGASSTKSNAYLGSDTAGSSYGRIFPANSSPSTRVNYTNSNIVGVAIDADNGYVYWARDNTYINSGDPTSGSSGTGGYAVPSGTGTNGILIPSIAAYHHTSLGKILINFGGYTTISISSSASDANGYGTFEYAPPTGYYALCTKNLAEYG